MLKRFISLFWALAVIASYVVYMWAARVGEEMRNLL